MFAGAHIRFTLDRDEDSLLQGYDRASETLAQNPFWSNEP